MQRGDKDRVIRIKEINGKQQGLKTRIKCILNLWKKQFTPSESAFSEGFCLVDITVASICGVDRKE